MPHLTNPNILYISICPLSDILSHCTARISGAIKLPHPQHDGNDNGCRPTAFLVPDSDLGVTDTRDTPRGGMPIIQQDKTRR